jgi:hypothetical protein
MFLRRSGDRRERERHGHGRALALVEWSGEVQAEAGQVGTSLDLRQRVFHAAHAQVVRCGAADVLENLRSLGLIVRVQALGSVAANAAVYIEA